MVSVIIVNWNVRDEVCACVEAALADDSKPSLEIIVVDNASSDGSVEALRQRFPSVRTVANEQNVGFASACNQAAALSRGAYLLLLNPDTRVFRGAIARLARYLDERPCVGGVGPKLLSADGSVQKSCARRFPSVHGWLFHRLQLTKLLPRNPYVASWEMGWWDHLSEREVECLSGACLMTPRAVFQQLGGLDTSLPMYFEDMEYCLRLMRRRLSVHYLPEAEVLHLGGKSSDKNLSATAILSARAVERFVTMRDGPFARVRFRVAVAFSSIIRALAISGAILARALAGWPRGRWFTRERLLREVALLCWSLGIPVRVETHGLEL